MNLFNASSLFNESGKNELLSVVDSPEQVREKIIQTKKMLLQLYRFKVFNIPEDFASASYIIATNHLTDSDAPLIMSFYYEEMSKAWDRYPKLFVFAKENCFNGVSIPKELAPVLESEKVLPVDRTSLGGSMAAMKAAKKWFDEGEKPKHFLIFSQGTIYDINQDKAEDIESGAFWLARILGIPVLPGFIEQAVEGEENRMIFGEPIPVEPDCRDFTLHKQMWIDRVIEAQNQLEPLTGIPARATVLDADHQVRKRFRPEK